MVIRGGFRNTSVCLSPALCVALLSGSALLAGCTGSVGGGDSGVVPGDQTRNTVPSGSSTNAPQGSDGAVPATGSTGSDPTSPTGADPTGATGTEPNTNPSTTSTAEPVVGSTDACPTTSVPRTPLRRLTRFEYGNTLRDLLNVDPSVALQLPADEVSNGYDNNASVLTVSSLHSEKHVLISEEVAATAVQNNLAGLTNNCDPAVTGEEACAQQFAQSFGRRAFRRPITAEDEQMLMNAYAAGRTDGSYAEGIEVMIRAALQSPYFLYRLETTAPVDPAAQMVPLDPFEIATRLSYLTWQSSPDDALLDAAAAGLLSTPEQVANKAREMLASPKAIDGLSHFYRQWSGTQRLEITTKNTDLFPLYSDAVNAGMVAELPALLEYVLNSDRRLSTLLTAPVAFVTDALAPVYGVTAPAGSDVGPQLVTLPDSQGRSGLLTQAGFLSVQAHPDQTSPVLRGKFVRAMLLCEPVPPPPDDVSITLPEVDQTATARERFSAHLTAGLSCNGCHQLMDPIGFSFENFDAMGQYRDVDAGQPIDASGEIVGTTDPALAGPYTGVRELGQKLAQSETVQNCIATQWMRFASGRLEGEEDACSLGTMQEQFRASGGDLIELVVAMTQTDAFWYRSPTL